MCGVKIWSLLWPFFSAPGGILQCAVFRRIDLPLNVERRGDTLKMFKPLYLHLCWWAAWEQMLRLNINVVRANTLFAIGWHGKKWACTLPTLVGKNKTRFRLRSWTPPLNGNKGSHLGMRREFVCLWREMTKYLEGISPEQRRMRPPPPPRAPQGIHISLQFHSGQVRAALWGTHTATEPTEQKEWEMCNFVSFPPPVYFHFSNPEFCVHSDDRNPPVQTHTGLLLREAITACFYLKVHQSPAHFRSQNKQVLCIHVLHLWPPPFATLSGSTGQMRDRCLFPRAFFFLQLRWWCLTE